MLRSKTMISANHQQIASFHPTNPS